MTNKVFVPYWKIQLQILGISRNPTIEPVKVIGSRGHFYSGQKSFNNQPWADVMKNFYGRNL
jgi:hypothetical protein